MRSRSDRARDTRNPKYLVTSARRFNSLPSFLPRRTSGVGRAKINAGRKIERFTGSDIVFGGLTPERKPEDI